MSDEAIQQVLGRRFPSAEPFVVLDLAARVAAGRAKLEQAAATLRSMGYDEVRSVPLELPSSSSSAPTAGNAAAVAMPGATANSSSSSDVGRTDAIPPPHHHPAVGRLPGSTVPSVPPAPSVTSGAPPAANERAVNFRRPTATTQARSRSAEGRRSPAQTPSSDTQAGAAVPPYDDEGVILFTTTVSGDRQTKDRIRGFERQLYLHEIPFHTMDVSENRFMRKQIIRMCDGVDRGLPLLFVGTNCVGTYDEVEGWIDDNVFLRRLAAAGYTHSVLEKKPAFIDPTCTEAAGPSPPSPAASEAPRAPPSPAQPTATAAQQRGAPMRTGGASTTTASRPSADPLSATYSGKSSAAAAHTAASNPRSGVRGVPPTYQQRLAAWHRML